MDEAMNQHSQKGCKLVIQFDSQQFSCPNLCSETAASSCDCV